MTTERLDPNDLRAAARIIRDACDRGGPPDDNTTLADRLDLAAEAASRPPTLSDWVRACEVSRLGAHIEDLRMQLRALAKRVDRIESALCAEVRALAKRVDRIESALCAEVVALPPMTKRGLSDYSLHLADGDCFVVVSITASGQSVTFDDFDLGWSKEVSLDETIAKVDAIRGLLAWLKAGNR